MLIDKYGRLFLSLGVRWLLTGKVVLKRLTMRMLTGGVRDSIRSDPSSELTATAVGPRGDQDMAANPLPHG